MTEPRYTAVSCGNHRIELPEGATREDAARAAGQVLLMARQEAESRLRMEYVIFEEMWPFQVREDG